MRPDASRFSLCFAASVAGVALIAGCVGASAQQPKPAPHPAAPIARPAAPAFHPAPAPMARPAAPPVMARPAAPAFHAAPAPPHPMAPHPMPHIAAPPRPAPHIAAPPHPAPHFAAPAHQAPPHIAAPAHPAPHVAAPRPERPAAVSPPASAARPSAPPAVSARSPRQELAAQRAQARETRILERHQVAQQRQRETLTRQTAEREKRIDRLQQRVQQAQAQPPQGRRAQRELATQQHLLQREQLAQQRDLARQQKLAAPAAAAASTAATAATATAATQAAQAAARGRFAARFRDNADPRAQVALAARLNGWAPRHAWRQHVRAAFVPWLGPVFWPYAYADIFDYTFWPGGYDDAYWAYAYDDFVDTVFWDVGSPYSAYASIAPEGGYLEPGGAIVGSQQLRARSGLSPRALRQLCSNPDQGVTAWPFAEITRAVRPSAEQRALLDQMKHAAAQAASAFKTSCTDSYALTPPGRLRAMINRISATLEAVRMVRPALEAFYNALSDEQQARFNALGPNLPATPEDQPRQEANAKPENCGAPKSSLTQLPIERIDTVLRPTGAQKDALDRLSNATKKAVQALQAACPDEVPLTPVGRLQAMERRLSAMLQAANQVQPALDDFYASLTGEQKARFNTLQQVARE